MRAAPSPKSANDLTKETVSWKADPAETGYGGAVDVVRAADLYAQGRTQGHVTCKGGKEFAALLARCLPDLATIPAHPDALLLPALVADTAAHVCRVGAVLKVAPTNCG